MDFRQLRAILWLRWRLTRNQWSRSGRVNAVITLVVVWMGLCLAVAGGAGGVLAGALALGEVSPLTLMFIWDGLALVFLFFWVMGTVTELQRSEMIELGRFLHLPVSLWDVFRLNYLASHFSFSLAMVLPAMLGLAVGLAFSRGPSLLLLIPLALGFFFMITAWTYCLREWLISLMVNQRRRRAIIMGLTLTVVLVGQLPNLVFNLWRPQERLNQQAAGVKQRNKAQALEAVALAHKVLPILWLPQGAQSLAEGRLWPAGLGATGMFLLGALGLRRAYRATLRFYQGTNQPGSAAPTQKRESRRDSQARLLVERRLPWVHEEAATVALVNFRSLSRAPEVRMTMIMSIVMILIMSGAVFLRAAPKLEAEFKPFVATGTVALAFFGMAQIMFNMFGFDRDGFRALVLLPTRRDRLLLGKNLSFLPLALVCFGLLLTLTTILARLPVGAVAPAFLQFTTAFLGLSLVGNLTSVLAPYRIASGSMKPTKTSALTLLMIMMVQMLFPLAMIPIFIPPALGALCAHFHWMPAAAVNGMGSLGLAALVGVGYGLGLRPLGELLQRREMRILEKVTQEVE